VATIENVTTDSVRPMRADARRNREKVLAAAREAFAEYGQELPMDEIARRAGVGVGTVYRHFPSKEALLDGLIVDHFGVIMETAEEGLASDDAWGAFQKAIWIGAERQAEDISLCEALFQRKAMAESNEVLQLRERLEGATEELVRRAQEAGKMRKDFDVVDLPLFFASMTGAIQMSRNYPDADWRRQLQRMIDGLAA
jgi:AcrR family transcriptional regulator